MDGKSIILYFIKKITGRLHSRISLRLYFEVEPAIYNDCSIFTSLTGLGGAEDQARREDELAEKYLDENGFIKKHKGGGKKHE